MKYGKYVAGGIIVLVAGAIAIKQASGIKNIFQPDAIGRDERGVTVANQTDGSECSKVVNPYGCFKDFYTKLVRSEGVDVAFADLKEKYKTDNYVVSQCHPLTHVIGREAALLYDTVGKAYLHGDSFCWSGYYHGVLEGIASRIGVDDLPKKMDSICVEIPGKASYNFDYFNCVHGLGHSVMELLGDDVFKSLAMCDNLSGNWEKESCYSGVFMENIIAYGLTGTSKYLKDDDLMYPCTAVENVYKNQCYLGQTSHALIKTNFDYKKIFDLCSTLEASYRDICNQSMGRDVANQAYHKAELTRDNCWLATDKRDRDNCVIGAVKEFISYYHSDKEANSFCAILPKDSMGNCQAVAASYYQSFK